jgi:hypothetical protein
MDYFENRTDRFRPLGDWALAFFKKAIEGSHTIVYSDLVVFELSNKYSADKVEDILSVIPDKLLKYVESTPKQTAQAIVLSRRLGIPKPDCLHYILSMDANACLVTRDRHFEAFKDVKSPEQLL